VINLQQPLVQATLDVNVEIPLAGVSVQASAAASPDGISVATSAQSGAGTLLDAAFSVYPSAPQPALGVPQSPAGAPQPPMGSPTPGSPYTPAPEPPPAPEPGSPVSGTPGSQNAAAPGSANVAAGVAPPAAAGVAVTESSLTATLQAFIAQSGASPGIAQIADPAIARSLIALALQSPGAQASLPSSAAALLGDAAALLRTATAAATPAASAAAFAQLATLVTGRAPDMAAAASALQTPAAARADTGIAVPFWDPTAREARPEKKRRVSERDDDDEEDPFTVDQERQAQDPVPAWRIEGAGGARWEAATWVGRRIFAYLIPALRRGGGGTLANAIEAGTQSETGTFSIRELLDDQLQSAVFARALDVALAQLERSGPSLCRNTDLLSAFLAKAGDLDRLARGDGNRYVLDLVRAAPCKIDSAT
jgi:hypothetical protein